MSASYRYHSGEEIQEGDHILYAGNPGEIEFIATIPGANAELDWYIEEYGGGVMLLVPKKFGRVFLTRTDNEEDLVFVSRKGGR